MTKCCIHYVAGVDYAMSTALVFNVTISAGSTSSSFSIDIIDDMIQEDNETFNIAIILLPSCLSLSVGNSSSTVTITDNEDTDIRTCVVLLVDNTIVSSSHIISYAIGSLFLVFQFVYIRTCVHADSISYT